MFGGQDCFELKFQVVVSHLVWVLACKFWFSRKVAGALSWYIYASTFIFEDSLTELGIIEAGQQAVVICLSSLPST